MAPDSHLAADDPVENCGTRCAPADPGPAGVSVMEVITPRTIATVPMTEDEQEPRDQPAHQNGCPTAKWKVNLPVAGRT